MGDQQLFFVTILVNTIITILLIIISRSTTLKAIKPKKTVKTNLITSILADVLLFMALFTLFGGVFFWNMFPGVALTQFIFTLTSGEQGANSSFITALMLSTIYAATPIFLFLVFIKYFRRDFILNIRKKAKINLSKLIRIAYKIVIPVIWLAAIISWSLAIGLPDHIRHLGQISEVISENYVPVEPSSITAPDKKRNLIFIFVESFETSAFSKNAGGAGDVNYFPRLTELTRRYGANFSTTDHIGGLYQVGGVSYTAAGLIAITSGLPYMLSSERREAWLTYEQPGDIVPQIPKDATIGDILRGYNYNQVFLTGSDAIYGGRAQYFQNYGGYQIHDLVWAKDQGLIPEDYDISWWGYEDRKLYEFAKDELRALSEQSQPFNLTMLTVDMHFNDGYLDESCATSYNAQYSNVLACTDNMLSDFIEWLQRQSFYDDTTVVITGDHLYMGNFYKDVDQSSRKVFATILNSPISPNTAGNRLYTHFDLFPTTLSALGFEIRGNRLALGTNLFSNQETLAEHFGVEQLNEELSKNFILNINEDY